MKKPTNKPNNRNNKSTYKPKKNQSTKEESLELDGVVTENLSNGRFRVKLENDMEILGHISGKIRTNYIRIMIGDRVKIEMSPYDLTIGRIIFRYR
jgi:translation initiation factor IF-1